MHKWFDAQLDQKILDGIYHLGQCTVKKAMKRIVLITHVIKSIKTINIITEVRFVVKMEAIEKSNLSAYSHYDFHKKLLSMKEGFFTSRYAILKSF